MLTLRYLFGSVHNCSGRIVALAVEEMKTLDFNTIVRSLKPRDLAVIRALREGAEIRIVRQRHGPHLELMTVSRGYELEKQAVNFLEGAGFIAHRKPNEDTAVFFLTQDGHRVATMCGYKEKP